MTFTDKEILILDIGACFPTRLISLVVLIMFRHVHFPISHSGTKTTQNDVYLGLKN